MEPGSVLLLVLSAGLLFLLLSRSRRQQRQAQSVQSRLEVGAEVMTSSGLFATVVEVEGSVVVLETAPGQHSRWDRRAVASILTEGGAGEPGPTGQTDTEPSDQTAPPDQQPEDRETPGRE